jgi:hypothetical protein
MKMHSCSTRQTADRFTYKVVSSNDVF